MLLLRVIDGRGELVEALARGQVGGGEDLWAVALPCHGLTGHLRASVVVGGREGQGIGCTEAETRNSMGNERQGVFA